MITADQLLVKQINKSLVLNCIRKKVEISRADIAKKTGLNRSTVSALVDELISEGLIKEKGTGASKGGRKPVILAINKNVGVTIGIELEVNYFLIVLTDLTGEIIWEKRIVISPEDSIDENIRKLKALIREAISNAPETLKGLMGIGIGVPGIVNYEKGIVLLAPNLKWKNVKLKEMIENEFKVPVFIDNEANAGAIGEKWFGYGEKASNFIYVTAGSGIGIGIIINNELYRGSSGLAGEMGHMTIDMNGKICSCENTGCWEEYASEKALFRYLRNQIEKNNIDSVINRDNIDRLTVFDIVDAAKAGNSIAIDAFKQMGKYLGIGVTNVINTFNPSLIIIGNTLSLVGDIVINEINKEVSRRCFVAKHFEVKIVTSKLNMYACAMGAVSLVISQIFAMPNLV